MLWTIGIEQRNGSIAAARCADVGAETVQVVTQLGGEPPETYQLPCDDYGAVTTAIRPGDYQVRMLLLDQRGRPMSDTGFGSFPVTLDRPAVLDADFVL
jgi:hypothetical protein